MNATFRVVDGFDLPSRKSWVLRGEIVSGSIQAGMFLLFPFNDAVEMTASIDAVEAIDDPSRRARIGLLLAYDDELGLDFWRALTAPGELLRVTDHDPAA